MNTENANQVTIYGLTSDEANRIMSASTGCSFFRAGCYQDVLAHPADLIVLNPDALNEDERRAISWYYKEIDPSVDRLILTKQCDGFEGLSNVEIVEDLFSNEEKITVTLLRSLHKTAKDYDYSRKMMLSLRIMKEITDNPGCSTKDIARNVEYSHLGYAIRRI